MAKSNKLTLCYPYGMGSTCICDGRGGHGVIYRCFHSLEALRTEEDLTGEAMLSRDDRAEHGLPGEAGDLGLEGLSSFGSRGLDEKTEIILAATFLVLIILAFISFVIYRCEKNYMRRRLQESFHLSPAAANGGFFTAFHGTGTGGHHGNQIPTISVSVQTEPSMVNTNGNLANTAALIQNGAANNGGILLGNSQPNPAALERPGNYATLPHPHHHLHSVHVTEADTITQHWSRDNLLAASYDVNLSTFANGGNNSNNGGSNGTNKPALGVHSRENTLSRDVHHITDYGALRSSCTAENLRSPSVAGIGRDRDIEDCDLNTDYAESDVMLGCNTGTNSNGSNNNSCEERTNARY